MLRWSGALAKSAAAIAVLCGCGVDGWYTQQPQWIRVTERFEGEPADPHDLSAREYLSAQGDFDGDGSLDEAYSENPKVRSSLSWR